MTNNFFWPLLLASAMFKADLHYCKTSTAMNLFIELLIKHTKCEKYVSILNNYSDERFNTT